MAEAVGAAAALVSVFGFSAQVFDGCVKGFVLLSSARSLSRDAETLSSKLEWEQYRLEKWAENVGLHDPVSKVDTLVDWDLISKTLQQLDSLLNDTSLLKSKYGLVLKEEPTENEAQKRADKPAKNASRFKRLFAQADTDSDTAHRVVRAKNSPVKRLWWASVDKDNFQRLLDDISYFVQRLHDSLNASVQKNMQDSLSQVLQQAVHRYSDVPDLEYLRELAAELNRSRNVDALDTQDLEEEIAKKFRNLLFWSISRGELTEVERLLDKGIDADCEEEGWSTLIRAADAGQAAMVKLLLERGGDPEQETGGGRRPLHFAAEGGHLDIVKTLLEWGVDYNYPDFQGQTAIFKACGNGHYDVVKTFLTLDKIDVNAATKDGFTPILQAGFGAHRETIQLLLARPELDVNHKESLYQQTPLWMAVSCKLDILQDHLKRKDIDLNAKARYGDTALCRCAEKSYHDSMRLLLDVGADVNLASDGGLTPLLYAAKGNEIGIELLLKQPGLLLGKRDPKGRTALFLAAEGGHTKCVRSLLTRMKHVDDKDESGKTPLAAASSNGHKIPVKMLHKAKADINTQDSKGNTPLALAAEGSHESVVRLLLESGADAEIADEDEETPFEKARDKHLDSIVQVFKEMKV